MMHTISLLDTISSARQPTIPYTALIDYAEVGTPRPAQQLREVYSYLRGGPFPCILHLFCRLGSTVCRCTPRVSPLLDKDRAVEHKSSGQEAFRSLWNTPLAR